MERDSRSGRNALTWGFRPHGCTRVRPGSVRDAEVVGSSPTVPTRKHQARAALRGGPLVCGAGSIAVHRASRNRDPGGRPYNPPMAGRSIALNSLIEDHRAEIRALLEPHNARSIAVFGSVARGEATVDSDIDFLVEFESGSSLLDLIRLEEALCDLLGVDVDVISLGALLERDDEIRSDAVTL